MINWNSLVKEQEQDLLADLEELLKIKSVNDDNHSTPDAPLGIGPAQALKRFLSYGKRDHFEVKNLDNLAGHIEMGNGDPDIGILVHVDEMPAGQGWQTEPFSPVIKNNCIFARGAFDDKGPAIAAYYAMKIVRALNVPIKHRVRLIIGTDEEVGWRGMTHYFKLMPKPALGFSPDQDFPVVNGEKGVANSWIKFENVSGKSPKLLEFHAGKRRNMVPGIATVVLKTNNSCKVKKEYNDFCKGYSLNGVYNVDESRGTIILTLKGKSAHAQEPLNGKNAGTYLALFLNGQELDSNAKSYIEFITNYLHQDSRMKKFGMSFSTKQMGELTVNSGIFSYDTTNGGLVELNYRYPKGLDVDKLFSSVKKVCISYGATSVKSEVDLPPHYVPVSDPLVKLMLEIYHKQTGLKAEGKTVGGGTFGRILKEGVAFGARFPDTPISIHQPNEFIPLHDLYAATSIYAELIYDLACKDDI